MAERRRRRCVRVTDDSEELSEGSENEQVNEKTSDAQESGGEKPGGESEYESAEEEDGSDEDVKLVRKKMTALNTSDVLVEEDEEDICDVEVEGEFYEHEDDDCVEGERQQGDGEESVTLQEKVLDDDEDRRNPQYIPKKGSFYEHDDRINSDTEADSEKKDVNYDLLYLANRQSLSQAAKLGHEELGIRDKKKKKLWLDEGHWGHDMYHEDEQAPKSREELIAIYGYDIRSEDGPPRARRRRRYGRGPTKYTRNWQDQTAYQKLRGQSRGRGTSQGRGRGRISNNFSERAEDEAYQSDETNSAPGVIDEVCESTSTDIIVNDSDFPALNDVNEQPVEIPVVTKNPPSVIDSNVSNGQGNTWIDGENTGKVQSRTFENSKFSQKTKEGEEDNNENRQEVRDGFKQSTWRTPSNYRGQFRYQSRGRSRRRGSGYRGGRGGSDSIIVSEMEKLSLRENENQPRRDQKWTRKDKTDYRKPQMNNCHQDTYSSSTTTVSATSDHNATRPKRYSSLRQRNVAESTVYQPTQTTLPPTYYDASYQAALYTATEALPPSSPHQTSTSPPMLPAAPFQTFATAPYQDSYAIRPPVPSPPRIFPPVTLATPPPQPALPAPYIAPTNGIVNYVPPPAGYPQYTFQQFATPPAPPPPVATVTTPPPELYRGIMYYSMHTQQHSARMLPQKRPTSAIPIVPPPERELIEKSNDSVQSVLEEEEETKELINNSTEIEALPSEETSLISKPTVEVES